MPLLPLHPPRPRPQRRDGEDRRVVDIERQCLQLPRRAREISKVLLTDLAHTEQLGADPALLREDARGELVGSISRLKKATPAPARLAGSTPSSSSCSQRRAVLNEMLVASAVLPMPGRPATITRSEFVESAGLGIDRLEASGEPGKAAAGIERLLRHLHGHSRCHREALHRALAAPLLGHAVERRLGIFDLALGIDLVGGVERALDHLPADAHQRAEQRQIVDLLGEIARADDRRARAGKLRQISRAAHLLHLLVRLEQGPQSHRRGDHILVEQPQNLLVDPPVQRLEEMLGAELELDVLGQPIVDH